MEALKLSGTARKGKLVLEIPDRFDKMELEVIVLTKDKDSIVERDLPSIQQEKVKQMLSIINSADYPDTPTSKYDVYNQ